MPTGMLLAALGMVLLTRIGVDTAYASHVLPSLILIGLGFGLVIAPPRLIQQAAVEGCTTAFWWAAAIVAAGALVTGGLLRSGVRTEAAHGAAEPVAA